MVRKTQTELNTQIDSDFPDNTTGLITPIKLRNVVKNVTDGVYTKFSEFVSVVDYGADPTGATFSHDAFNKALDENERVYVPPGTYLVGNPIFISRNNRTLIGAGESSIIKLDSGSFVTDSVALVGILQENATIPASGSVELKIKWEYRSIAAPHAGQISPVAAVEGSHGTFLSPPTTLLAKNRTHPGTIAGIAGTLIRNNNNQFIFTRNISGSATNVIVGTHRFDGQTITVTKGILSIVSIGYDSNNSYFVKNVTVSGLSFRGITYQELSANLTQAVANAYTLDAWLGKRRIPFYIFGAKTSQVKINNCLFENNSFEGLWFANNFENTFYQIENNVVNDTGYEIQNGSVLPAIQGNLSKSIISNNIVNRSGIAISASGDHLKVCNNQCHGFYGEGITWGDTDCKNIIISENEVYNTDENLPVGSPIPTVAPVAYRGFYSGNNAPYKNMIIRGNTAHFLNTYGTGILISSPTESLVTNNRIYFESPTTSSSGIVLEPSVANSQLTFNLDGNSIVFESLPANVLFFGIVAIPAETTNSIRVLMKNNTISGLTEGNTNHFAFDIRDSGGGTIALASFNGDTKTAGQVRLCNSIVAVDNNTAIHLARSTNGTASGATIKAFFLDAPTSGNNLNFFKSNSPPSASLVAGDVWYELNTDGTVREIWAWNGSVWVSSTTYQNIVELGGVTGGAATSSPFKFAQTSNILVTRIRFTGRVEAAISPGGTIDSSSNYYSFNLQTIRGGGNLENITGFSPISMQGRTYAQFSPVWLNSAILSATINTSNIDGLANVDRGWFLEVTKTGATAFNITAFCVIIAFKLIRTT